MEVFNVIRRSTNDLFRETNKVMKNLNDDYEKMSELNRIKSSEIRISIKQKSDNLKANKKQRSKHFDFIRNK